MAVSPDGHYLAVTNNGHGKQTIDLIDLKADRLVNRVEIGRAWLGLRFESRRPFLYASGGNDNIVIRYEWKKDRLINKDTLTLGAAWPKENIGPAGLDVDDNRRLLYVVTKENNSLYVFDLNTKAVLRRIPLSTQAYTCLLNPSGTELYISAWGGGKVWIYNTATNSLMDSITTEDHPNDMVLSHNGKWLFVGPNANSNSVSVISTAERKVVETLDAALYPMALIGSTTNSAQLFPLTIRRSISPMLIIIAWLFSTYRTPVIAGPKDSSLQAGTRPACESGRPEDPFVSNGKGNVLVSELERISTG